MGGEDCRGQEREQGFSRMRQLAAGCGVCHPGKARGMRRAGSSAGGGVVSCGGQERLVWSQALPHFLHPSGRQSQISLHPAGEGVPACPEFVEKRCWLFGLGVQVGLCIL